MTTPGPRPLGRSVVVEGDAVVPSWWAGCQVVDVGEATLAEPAAVVGQLHDAWGDRRPVVIRLLVDAARFRSPVSYPAEPWTLPADFDVWLDRLHFLVWANSYDARRNPEEPVWWWGRKALRLGALDADGAGGDVRLPDGRPAWVDGGPRGPLPPSVLDGAVVVHRESVEQDRLDVQSPPAAPTAELAPDQLAAVGHGAGPARVVAPAGSGKTRVLTERLRHLVVDRGWGRDGVLAVAYNKRAQLELDARTADFAPRTRTLNSLGLAVVRAALGRPPEVLDEKEVRRIVERLAPPQRRRANTDPIGPYLEGLSAVRLGLRDPAEVEASRDDVPGLAALWPRFRQALAERGAVDFDQQIYGAVEALLADGALRAALQPGCRHLLVDELQDLTPAHVLLLRLLCSPGLDCFGVGDDDQVIYGHAGADPAFLLGYERLFPGAADHPLEVNYRCPPVVVRAAASLLSYNRRRVQKVIRPGRDDGDDTALRVVSHPPRGAATELVSIVRSWQGEVAPAAMAVLARVNSLLLAPHVALVSAGVPVDSTVGPELLERTGVRAALAYLRLASAADGALAGRDIVEVLRRPSRGLPPWFAERIRRRADWSEPALLDLIGAVPDKDSGKVEQLVDDLLSLRAAARGGADAARLLRLVGADIGLGGAMSLLDRGRGGEGSSHVDDLQALEEVAGLHQDPATLEAWLRDRLEAPAHPDGVTLATVHRVKGMEWDRVAVYGVVAGIMPHRLAEDVEEERRVLHVAITRGRERVVVLADAQRPSPFLGELAGTAPHTAPPLEPRACARGGAASLQVPKDGRARRRAGASSEPAATADADPALADALRAWRRQRAGADGVPAYVVFPDRTLFAIAAAKPTTLLELRAIDGIGPTKLELYGEAILGVVADDGTS